MDLKTVLLLNTLFIIKIFFMKKIIVFLLMAAVLTLSFCTDQTKEVKKEVVVPVEPTIIVKDPPAKVTTITLDKKGVKVETKKVKINFDK